MFHGNQGERCGVACLRMPILAALVWLMIPVSMQAAIPQQERAALIAYYNSTNGAQWDLEHTWLGPIGSECAWSGVTCDSAQRTVIELKVMVAGGIVGFPPELGDLTNLQVLSISGVADGANLNGDVLPKEIGNLKNLQELTLTGYAAWGGIPVEIGNLTNLIKLSIIGLFFHGDIPAEIGNLAKLQQLQISSCGWFRGSIPATLGNLTELITLNLSHMYFVGNIPAEIGNLNKLQELVISDCYPLGGSIPATLGNLTELTTLNLSRNGLEGNIPPELGKLTKLQTLNLHVSLQISGPIPAELGNLTKLQILDLSASHLSGPILTELGNLTELTTLNLSGNLYLTGSIPPSLGHLTKLQQLDLHGIGLTGPIPAELGNLIKLQTLDLSFNYRPYGTHGLTGPIPAELGNLTELTDLRLYSNYLEGSIPPALGNLTKLQRFDLSSNPYLTGPIPAELGNLKELNILNLNFNRLLSGAIPPSLGNLSKIQWLGLMTNQLSGPIPAELGNLTELQSLQLSNNQLCGPIPAELGNLTELTDLRLSSNHLDGSIPLALGNMTKLVQLYLGDNQLSGPIPAELGNLTGLGDLTLNNNHLDGSIPPALGNLTKLSSLYFHGNQLSGGIPAGLGNLTQLTFFSLARNQLTGNLPPSLSKLALLVQFDLSYNGLYTADSALRAFLDAHATWGNQTVAPESVSAQPESSSTVLVQWAPIGFTAYTGRYEVWVSTTRRGPYTLAGATVDKLASSLRISSLSAVPTYYLVVRTISDPNSSNQNMVTSDFSGEISIAMPVAATDLTLSAGGAAAAATIGSTGALQTGYAQVDMNSGNAFYGIAVYSYRPDGIVVSECGVPASPPTTSARIFVDYRTGATIPGSSGKVNVDTGLALVNRGAGPALITFTLRNLNGQVLSLGTGSLAQDAHIAKYLWELPAMVSGFSIPATFATETRYGTLEIASDQPLSVVALRLTTNQRGEMLMTSTPVANLTRPLSTAPIYFAEFIDGGGYTTALMLLNTSSVMMTGMLRIYDNDGAALAVQQVGGASGSAFAYSILPGGAYVLQTDAAPVNFNVGWAELIPDPGTPTPMGAGVYQSSQEGVLAAESGIAAAIPTTHARIFVDTAGGHNSSMALANPGTAAASIAFAALGVDGTAAVGTSVGPMTLNGKGHAAQFVWERISGLPEGFRGVLDIVSTAPFVPLTIRALVNERGNFLFTAFPVADLNQAAPSPILFPQIAAGGGTTTEIIMLSAGAAGAATLRYFGNAGTPLAIGK